MNHTASFTDLVAELKKTTPEITIETVKQMLCNKTNSNFVLIDVRESEEWDEGYILGAIHLSKGILERDIEKFVPNKNTKLVLYCGGGSRSLISAFNILKMGYSD
ncbi:MAG: sulfurtransferase, partial [Gammaproteobacteria bacterium]|nr:sulfurtransferase [Gammaproteobacteria bacterium]